MAVIGANEVRVGNVIAYEGGSYRILKKNHVKPGKGGAFLQLEMKEITKATKRNERISTDDKLERLETEARPLQYTHKDGNMVVLMDMQTFEQIEVDGDMFGEYSAFLGEEPIEVTAEYVGDGESKMLVSVMMPQQLEGEVAETEVHIKGGTVTGTFKPALLTNGFKTSVPPYIENGQRIIISSETGEFVKKAD